MIFLSILFVLLVSKDAPAEKRIRIAVLPFDNLSNEFCLIDDIMDRVYRVLQERVDMPTKQEIDDIMMALRLRHTGFLNTQESLKIGEQLNVQGILTGFITLFKEGSSTEGGEPQIGIIIKLISTKENAPLVWMESRLATGSNMETWFGLNRIIDSGQLIDNFINHLFRDIPFDKLETPVKR